MRHLVAVLCLVFLCDPALVAQGPPSPTRTPAEKERPADAAASFVFEAHDTRARFERDGTGRREVSLKVRLIDDAGARQWTQIPFMYAPESEELSLARVEVHKRDGRTMAVGADAVQDLAIRPSETLPIFLDLRQKLVTVPALERGDAVVVAAAWNVVRPLARNQFWFEYRFMTANVVRNERLEINVPAETSPIVRVRPGAPAEESGGAGVLEGNRRVYRWTHANNAVAADSDDAAEEEPSPDVRLTTFRNWDELAGWFSGLMKDAPDGPVRAKAAELTKGLTDPARKIEAIYRYVSTQVRYVSLSFGLGRFAPHAPADVLKNQYGDCKDKHALFAALLAAIDVEAWPVLINTGRPISEDVPSPAEFDHVITVLPSGSDPARWTWLDTTTEVAPFGMLVSAIRGKRGLLVGPSVKERLVSTPADPPFAMRDRIEIDGRVNPIGVLDARVRLLLRSDSELLTRTYLRSLPPDAIATFVKRLAVGSGLDGEVSNTQTSDPTDTREPLAITFTLRRGKYLDWAAPSSTVTPLPADPRGPFQRDTWVVKKDRRMVPILLQLHAVVELPDGYAAQAPVAVNVSRGGVEYRAEYRVEGRRLIADREMRITTRTLSASQAAEYETLSRAVTADFAQRFSVRGTVTGVPEIPPDVGAADLYSAGYSAYENKKYEAALSMWERTTQLDPKMTSAWNGIAFAHLRLGHHAEAIAALEKQIAIDPLDKKAYSDLGYVHDEAGNVEAAIKAYTKHVELNPLDGNAFRQLGELHSERNHHADAVTALEKAISLGAGDGWAHVLLGAALLDLGQQDRAKRAFDRALETSSTVAVWTKIAYELAHHGLDTERVFDLAGRTTKHVREKLATTTLDTVADEHLDLVERLAWAWDALGLAYLRKGNTEAALKYSRAAWRLNGESSTAEHLGQVYEKLGRQADALSAYLTAQTLASTPSEALRARIARLAGGDLPQEFKTAAEDVLLRERAVMFTGGDVSGDGEYLALVQRNRRVSDLKMFSASDAIRQFESKLREMEFPLEFPDSDPLQLVMKIIVRCRPAQGCAALLEFPWRAELPR